MLKLRICYFDGLMLSILIFEVVCGKDIYKVEH